MHVSINKTIYPSYNTDVPQIWNLDQMLACEAGKDDKGNHTVKARWGGETLLSHFTDAAERDQLLATIARCTGASSTSRVQPTLDNTPATSPMKTVLTDIKAFIAENRNAIYLVAAILIIDHCFLGGRLTDRIKAIAEKLLGKVESKVDALTDSSTAVAARS